MQKRFDGDSISDKVVKFHTEKGLRKKSSKKARRMHVEDKAKRIEQTTLF